MTAGSLWIAAALLAAGRFAAAQDGEAPAIAQGGILNLASRIPVQQPMGAAAPGSLISIRGFRFGPAAPKQVVVRIRRADVRVETPAISVNENEIEAIVPQTAPLGSVVLEVVRNGHTSLEWPIQIVESSFGAFSQNRQGWGPGQISNADGVMNSEARPAKPGETVTIAGTGLGAGATMRAAPQVLVGGVAASNVTALKRPADRPGVDTLRFQLPAAAPEGCHVPVLVSSAPGIYGNSVSMAISRDGSRCTDRFDWVASFRGQRLRLAMAGLIHADLEMGPTARDTSAYPIDAGFVSFSEIDQDASVNPLFLFPPVGTCTTYVGALGLRISSRLGLLDTMQGKPLDAGPGVTIRGPAGEQLLPATSYKGRYWQLLGGRPPAPGVKAEPLFIKPGQYQISAPGGVDVGAFHASMRAESPLVWRNRKQVGKVDRSRGATVTWLSPDRPATKVVLVVAMSEESQTGASGVCACLANASAGKFQIPAYALANIPPTPAHPRGFPLNLILLVELPGVPVTASRVTGVDGVLAFGASVSGRTVQFK
ncbi:MAG TPA: hypothetical protein VKX49_06905 [Bryobacteraceae bacterium]|nr:hypothetical protein [Bryobacteraceae bacterium]